MTDREATRESLATEPCPLCDRRLPWSYLENHLEAHRSDGMPVLPDWVQVKAAENRERETAASHRIKIINKALRKVGNPDWDINAPSWVYWLCDSDGAPLYIGKSERVADRLTTHLRRAEKDPWVWGFDDIRLFRCGTPDAADALERRMIDTHSPPRNVQRWKPTPIQQGGKA